MKILICMAVYDTKDNGRTKYTKETLTRLVDSINHNTTQIVVIDNDSCEETKQFLKDAFGFRVLTNDKNVGTAEAINLGIHEYASNDTYCVKIDNDCVIQDDLWADEMVECFQADPTLGVLGLKRKDLPNSPYSKEYPTVIEKLSNGKIIEICGDVIGTCHMYSPELLKKVGYLYQPGLYAFDDVLMCHRSLLNGFRNAFYPSVEIDHIDTGGDFYTEWKRKYAGAQWELFEEKIRDYENDLSLTYYNPF